MKIVDKMLSVLKFYNWNRVSLIVQNTSKWRTMGESFEKLNVMNGINITVVSTNLFEDTSLCCSLMRPCCNRPWSYEIFQSIKSYAKCTFSSLMIIIVCFLANHPIHIFSSYLLWWFDTPKAVSSDNWGCYLKQSKPISCNIQWFGSVQSIQSSSIFETYDLF